MIMSSKLKVFDETTFFDENLFIEYNMFAGISDCFENMYELRNCYDRAIAELSAGIKANNGQRIFVYQPPEERFSDNVIDSVDPAVVADFVDTKSADNSYTVFIIQRDDTNISFAASPHFRIPFLKPFHIFQCFFRIVRLLFVKVSAIDVALRSVNTDGRYQR